MARRRSALISLSPLRSPAAMAPGVADSSSGSLHAGQRLAKPGLSGLSSNSWEQMAQTRIGNGITISMVKERTVHSEQWAMDSGKQTSCGNDRQKNYE